MYWKTFSDFLAMGNHGFYVWGSVIVFAIVLVLEPLLVKQAHKGLVARLKRELAAESSEAGSKLKLSENVN
jgi:heme exporter protein CcmD